MILKTDLNLHTIHTSRFESDMLSVCYTGKVKIAAMNKQQILTLQETSDDCNNAQMCQIINFDTPFKY